MMVSVGQFGCRASRLRRVGCTLLLLVCLISPVAGTSARQDAPAASQIRGKKLILKDGTVHVARSYQVIEPSPEQKARGAEDRVRYYSLERGAWEEIPASLVDWAATKKAETEQTRLTEELTGKARSVKKAQIAEDVDVDSSIQIAEGIFMPDGIGFWVFDGKQLLPLKQNMAEVKLDKGRLLTQILVPVPVVPTRHKVYLPGASAALKISTPKPEFYMRTEDGREPELELVRVQVKDDKRLVELISTIFTGDKESKRDTITAEKWVIAKGLFRITLSLPLEPGEYVLAEIVPDQGMNLYLWDFSVSGPLGKKSK